MDTPEIIVSGKENGEGMIVRYRTARGIDIFGLGMPNIYSNTDWDLGPTWCYLVLGNKTTLIDTGRYGNLRVLESFLQSMGKKPSDIHRIIITHSHEDHDGNLPDILRETQAELWAHEIYGSMIAYYPQIENGARHPDLPGSCRMCLMPESVRQHCIPYHQKRSMLKLDFGIKDNVSFAEDGLRFLFTPGHSPDSICIVLDEAVIFTGDTVLPDITPHPSLASAFQANLPILPKEYQFENDVYGLMNYIRSLAKIASFSSEQLPAFPAHRLFYNGQFNLIRSVSQRSREIIQFHADRCHAILDIIRDGPSTMQKIVINHFPSSQIQGFGKNMAINEVLAHLELMEECGDVRFIGEERDVVEWTGSTKYVAIIETHLSLCQRQ